MFLNLLFFNIMIYCMIWDKVSEYWKNAVDEEPIHERESGEGNEYDLKLRCNCNKIITHRKCLELLVFVHFINWNGNLVNNWVIIWNILFFKISPMDEGICEVVLSQGSNFRFSSNLQNTRAVSFKLIIFKNLKS